VSLQSFLAIVAFIMIIVGLLFLSMIHLFMIPKDVMKRDTEKRDEDGGAQGDGEVPAPAIDELPPAPENAQKH